MSIKTNYFPPLFFANLLLFCLSFSTSVHSGDLLEFSKKTLIPSLNNVVYEGNIGLEIVSEESSVVPGEFIHMGLRIIHDSQWHTYWSNPGDSGLPTSIEWNFSDANSLWKVENIQWPTPKRIFVGPLVNFGFDEEILLIQRLSAPNNLKIGGKLKLSADVNWLVCKDICIPGSKRLELEIPVVDNIKKRRLSENSLLFVKARKKQPVEELRSNGVKAVFNLNNKSLVLFHDSKDKTNNFHPFDATPGFFFPLQEGLIKPAEDQIFYNLKQNNNSSLSNEFKTWMLEIKLAESSQELIQKVTSSKEVQGIFVDEGGNGKFWSVDIVQDSYLPNKGKKLNFGEKNPLTKSFSDSLIQIAKAVFFAFLGGLILNLMPCVFPVVGLKVLSITQGIKDQALLMKHGIGFIAGVILSVMSFAVFFVVFRELGHSVGWGLQLQNAWVVLGLSMLFAAIAMNLVGAFEFGSSLSSLGKYDVGKGFSGSFFSGVLTVIVASPCTAPFMGAAMGFAATANLYVVFFIFFSLAVGISTPYFVLISQPNLLKKLPKPGEWMVQLRQFLAFPMLAASGWLFWVLIELNGSRALFPGWLAILFCCLSLWVWGKFFQIATVKIRTKVAFSPLLIISFLLCVFFFFTAVLSIKNNTNSNQSINEMVTNDESTYERNGINWIPWQEQLAKEYVENGFVVFIDFTASWCVICQTNKIRVLDTSPVIQVLSQPGIVTLRADWTNSDSKITQALFEYGRIGIPLNVVLGPNLSKPIVLSEWLTKSEVLDAILKAKN